MYWYYLNDEQRIGPVTEAQIHDLIRRGVVHRETPVWREGMSAWTEAGTAPDLPPAGPTPAPAAPPPTETSHPGPPSQATEPSPAALLGMSPAQVLTRVTDNESRAARARQLLGLSAVLAVVSLLLRAHEVLLLMQVAGGAEVSQTRAEIHDLATSGVAMLQFLLLLVTGLVFLGWFRRAHEHLPLLGAEDLRFSPGWAVGYWFIPILNLVRPYHVALEIWNASYRATVTHDPSGVLSEDPRHEFLTTWWYLFVGMSLSSNFAARLSMGADNLADMTTASVGYLVSDVLTVFCAVAASKVVERIQNAQSDAASLVALS